MLIIPEILTYIILALLGIFCACKVGYLLSTRMTILFIFGVLFGVLFFALKMLLITRVVAGL